MTIEKLTEEQEALLSVYRDKWLAIGLSTARIDRPKAIEQFMIFNKLVLEKKERPVVVFMDSPLTAWIATVMMYQFIKQCQPEQVWSQVESQVGSQVRSQVGSQVWSQVESQVRSQVRSQVGSQVWSQVLSQVRSQVPDFVYPYLEGQFDSPYMSFMDYCNTVLGIRFDVQKKWDCYLKTSDLGLIYPFNEFVVISEKPTDIRMRNTILHNDGGPAIQYADGFSVWALNGVRVPKELVMTPADKLDPESVLTEKNTDIQREMIRKIGVERVLQHCNAKTLDVWKDQNTGFEYKLLDMSIGENIRRKYLHFEHATLKGVYYAKPIPPEVTKAMHERAWILSLIERDNLAHVDTATEAQILANLPATVS